MPARTAPMPTVHEMDDGQSEQTAPLWGGSGRTQRAGTMLRWGRVMCVLIRGAAARRPWLDRHVRPGRFCHAVR